MIQKLTPEQQTTFRRDMVDIDSKKFAECVDLKPFPIKHDLSRHPLFQLDSLIDLAKRLPKQQREYVFAKKEFGTHEDQANYQHAAENDELSTTELIEAIGEQNIVIVLRNVESDDIYGEFVNQSLDELSDLVEPVTGKMSGRESYIFISPPEAYTPYHYDPEQNFFMQIRGRKQMAIYDVNDREVLPDSSLEKFYCEGQKIINCKEDLFDRYTLFDMEPGDGVYVPVTAPHWVRTCDEISISVSINFRTPSSVRRDRVYRFNRQLRKFGWNSGTVSPRANRWHERLKSGILEVPAKLKKLMGRG